MKLKHNKEIWPMAYDKGGYREKYAMDHGKPNVIYAKDRRSVRFVYGLDDPYQDANGAEYDLTNNVWVD